MSRVNVSFLPSFTVTQRRLVVVRMNACAGSSRECATSRMRWLSFCKTKWETGCNSRVCKSNKWRVLGLDSKRSRRGGCDSGSTDMRDCSGGLLARVTERLDGLRYLCPKDNHKSLCGCGSAMEFEGSFGMYPDTILPHIFMTGIRFFGRRFRRPVISHTLQYPAWSMMAN
jgi:hypothetical protein